MQWLAIYMPQRWPVGFAWYSIFDQASIYILTDNSLLILYKLFRYLIWCLTFNNKTTVKYSSYDFLSKVYV